MPDKGTNDDQIDRWRTIATDGTFEAALVALDEIVAFLEAGNRALSDTIAAYEIGTLVANRCESLLSDAELRVSQIPVGPAVSRPVRFIGVTDDKSADDGDEDEAVEQRDAEEPPF